MRRVLPAVTVLVLASAVALPSWLAPRVSPFPRRVATSAPGADRTLARELFYQLNDERGARGLPLLTWSNALASVARSHSRTMAEAGSVQTFHLRPTLTQPDLASYNALGENVLGASEATTTGQIDAAWMDTRQQRETMLSRGFTSVGLSVVCAPDGRVWSTQTFGRSRRSRAPIYVAARAHPVVARLSGSSCASAAGDAPTSGTPPPPDPSPPPRGLVGGAGFTEGSAILGNHDRELARHLDGIAATGVQWLRIDVRWPDVEPARGRFAWGSVDRIVHAARARGLRVLATLDYTPTWARPTRTDEKTPPTNPADFARFAAATARHFATSIRSWEIWNEENSSAFWATGANPKRYTALLIGAYDAIKAVDRGAIVITGGTAPANTGDGSMAPVEFLEGIYAAGGGGHFDAVAHHAYHWPYLPLDATADFNDNSFGGVTPRLHDVMTAHGDGAKRIWLTEVGAPVPGTRDGRHTTPAFLAAYITEAFAVARAWSWTGPMFWFSYRDRGTDRTDPEDNFGIVTNTFTPKGLALHAFVAASRRR